MASLQLKKKTYWAVFANGSNRQWIKIGNVTKTQAKVILKQLEAEVATERLELLNLKKINFYEFSEKYLEYVKTNTLRPHINVKPILYQGDNTQNAAKKP